MFDVLTMRAREYLDGSVVMMRLINRQGGRNYRRWVAVHFVIRPIVVDWKPIVVWRNAKVISIGNGLFIVEFLFHQDGRITHKLFHGSEQASVI